MKKRNLYKLELMRNNSYYKYVSVIRTDNNYGLQGYVYEDGTVRKIYTPYTIPDYIIKEALIIMQNER